MAFGGFGKEDHQPMAEINTTPLVDVMLVLLVVFIIAAPLLTHSVQIALPKASAAEHQEKPQAVQLTIDAGGQFFLDNVAIEEAALQQKFKSAAAAEPTVELHLRADKKVPYESVAKAMALAQQSGISRIGFVTEAP